MKVDLTEKELTIIVLITVFSLVWSIIAMPYLMSTEWFKTLIPPLQYLIINTGFITLFAVLLGTPLTYLIKKEIDAQMIIRTGLSSWLGASLIFDLFQPPYYINMNGEILLNVPSALTGTAVDATVAWIWQQLGVSGPLLFYCVYLFTPIIVVLVMALLLTGKEFVNAFRKIIS